MQEQKDGAAATEDASAKKKVFGLGEIVLVSLVVGSVDLFTIIMNLIGLVPVVGEATIFMASFVGGAATFLLQLYLSLKGVKNLWLLVGGIIDSIPLANFLPTLTIGWIIVVLMENYPRLKKVTDKAEKAVGKTGVGKVVEKL